MAKLKEFILTKYIRGVELQILCVTSSKKKFAELLDATSSYINSYSSSFEPRTPICIENPDILYAKSGMGGEAFHIFKRDEVKLLSEYVELIDEHRKVYPTYHDYYEAKKND